GSRFAPAAGVRAGALSRRLSDRSPESAAVACASASIGPQITARPTTAPQPPTGRLPDFTADTTPVQTSGPGPIQLLAQRHADTVFVHGDVFAPNITWVFFSLQAADGRVAGWASVSVPGSTGAAAATGEPALRFD